MTVALPHQGVQPGISDNGRNRFFKTKNVYNSGIADLQIVYQSGKENVNADALSRYPQDSAPTISETESEFQVSAIASETFHAISDLLHAEPTSAIDHLHSFAQEQ